MLPDMEIHVNMKTDFGCEGYDHASPAAHLGVISAGALSTTTAVNDSSYHTGFPTTHKHDWQRPPALSR